MFDTIILEDEIELPEFNASPQEIEWQTKTIQKQPIMDVYKLTNDGRLHRQKQSFRDMTEDEMIQRAKKAGYDSWEEWENSDSAFGPLDSWKRVVDETWWVDEDRHGSFEIHGSTRRLDNHEDIYWSYEIRFTNGDLDEIILLSKKST